VTVVSDRKVSSHGYKTGATPSTSIVPLLFGLTFTVRLE